MVTAALKVQGSNVGRSPWLLKLYYVLSAPISIHFILNSTKFHPAYKISLWRKYSLGVRFFLNKFRVPTGISYKAHLVMALKLFETPPEVVGDVVECGTWKGGTAANLSMICKLAGRKLKIYDSFRGLPPNVEGEKELYTEGDYAGTLDEVKANIRRCGDINSCEFIEGWFEDTLPHETSPVLLAFLDVDIESSLETCVRHLWPRLTDQGHIFIDEYHGLDYCSLFWSERWWRETFNQTPPGLIGSGVGLPLGEFYVGPSRERGDHPLQHPNAAAYTRKDFSGHWTFYPNRPVQRPSPH